MVIAAGTDRVPRRFRFGAAFFPPMRARDASETARLVEELGYDDLWIPDQSFHHDPFILLTRCAGATSSIRLGVAVTNPLTRHPVQIARASATLAELSGGRFVLGLGAGNRSRVLPSVEALDLGGRLRAELRLHGLDAGQQVRGLDLALFRALQEVVGRGLRRRLLGHQGRHALGDRREQVAQLAQRVADVVRVQGSRSAQPNGLKASIRS